MFDLLDYDTIMLIIFYIFFFILFIFKFTFLSMVNYAINNMKIKINMLDKFYNIYVNSIFELIYIILIIFFNIAMIYVSYHKKIFKKVTSFDKFLMSESIGIFNDIKNDVDFNTDNQYLLLIKYSYPDIINEPSLNILFNIYDILMYVNNQNINIENAFKILTKQSKMTQNVDEKIIDIVQQLYENPRIEIFYVMILLFIFDYNKNNKKKIYLVDNINVMNQYSYELLFNKFNNDIANKQDIFAKLKYKYIFNIVYNVEENEKAIVKNYFDLEVYTINSKKSYLLKDMSTINKLYADIFDKKTNFSFTNEFFSYIKKLCL